MGGSRSGEPDDDHGRVKLDVERFGVAAYEVFEAQARREETDEAALDDEAPESGEAGVGIDRRARGTEPVEQCRVAEVVVASGFDRGGQQRLDRYLDVERAREV